MKTLKSVKDYLTDTAEFDYGHYRPKKMRFSPPEFSKQGTADVDASPQGSKYKTPKEKQAMGLLGEDSGSSIERLHRMLNKAGIADDEIKAGLQLTATGNHKVAAGLGIAASAVDALINSLRAKLSNDERRLEDAYESLLREDGRFSYETDINQNVTVRDAETGKEAYLQGTDASDLLAKLKGAPDPQQVLATVEPLMESSGEPEMGFEAQIKSDSGTYNMPWKTKSGHGTMTVFYTVKGGKPSMDVISVRDAEGNEFDPDEDEHESLLQQAKDFIGHE